MNLISSKSKILLSSSEMFEYHLLEQLRNLSLTQQVDFLDDILQAKGIKKEVKIKRGVVNHIYRFGRYVLVLGLNNKKIGFACLMDADIYDTYVQDRMISTRNKCKGDALKNIPIIYSNKEYYPIHHLACPNNNKEMEIDHINHAQFDVTRENLRVCSSYENKLNKSDKNIIYNNRIVFYYRVLSSKAKDFLTDRGYSIMPRYDSYMISSKERFNNPDDLYKEVNFIENTLFKSFRYNPMNDYCNTWYANIMFKIGLVSEKVLDCFQYNYILNNSKRKDIIEYYKVNEMLLSKYSNQLSPAYGV